jgi:hypothetical protein
MRDFGEQTEWVDRAPSVAEIRARIRLHVDRIFAHLEVPADHRVFDEVKRSLIPLHFALGRLFLTYFLARRQADSKDWIQGTWPWNSSPSTIHLLPTFHPTIRTTTSSPSTSCKTRGFPVWPPPSCTDILGEVGNLSSTVP